MREKLLGWFGVAHGDPHRRPHGERGRHGGPHGHAHGVVDPTIATTERGIFASFSTGRGSPKT